jgi:hypothetical protein
MQLRLGAHLAWYVPERVSTLQIDLAGPTPLRRVAEGLNLPLGEIALVTVNDQLTPLDTALVCDEDCVALYPAICAG